MGEQVKLTASDGHELSGYAARPEGVSRGGVVVVQEIFGVNSSIRGVVDDYAAQGYTAIAPAIFDRFARGVDIGYGPEDMKVAFGYYGQLSVEKALLDIAAAFRQLKTDGVQAVAVTGFCYGGLMSWLSATRGEAEGMNLACTIGYYAGGVVWICQRGSGVPGDAALWRRRFAYWSGPGGCGAECASGGRDQPVRGRWAWVCESDACRVRAGTGEAGPGADACVSGQASGLVEEAYRPLRLWLLGAGWEITQERRAGDLRRGQPGTEMTPGAALFGFPSST